MRKLFILYAIILLAMPVMAQRKISELPDKTTIDNDGYEYMYMWDYGIGKRVAIATLLSPLADTAAVLRTEVNDTVGKLKNYIDANVAGGGYMQYTTGYYGAYPMLWLEDLNSTSTYLHYPGLALGMGLTDSYQGNYKLYVNGEGFFSDALTIGTAQLSNTTNGLTITDNNFIGGISILDLYNLNRTLSDTATIDINSNSYYIKNGTDNRLVVTPTLFNAYAPGITLQAGANGLTLSTTGIMNFADGDTTLSLKNLSSTGGGLVSVLPDSAGVPILTSNGSINYLYAVELDTTLFTISANEVTGLDTYIEENFSGLESWSELSNTGNGLQINGTNTAGSAPLLDIQALNSTVFEVDSDTTRVLNTLSAYEVIKIAPNSNAGWLDVPTNFHIINDGTTYASFDNTGTISVNAINVGEIIQFVPQLTAPSSPSNGDMYYGIDGDLHFYRNNAWHTIDMTAE